MPVCESVPSCCVSCLSFTWRASTISVGQCRICASTICASTICVGQHYVQHPYMNVSISHLKCATTCNATYMCAPIALGNIKSIYHKSVEQYRCESTVIAMQPYMYFILNTRVLHRTVSALIIALGNKKCIRMLQNTIHRISRYCNALQPCICICICICISTTNQI